MDLAETHLIDSGLLGGIDFEGDDSVLAVVSPELILAGFRIPLLALVLPVQVVLAVHGGKEVQALLQVREQGMLGEHGVALEAGEEVKVAVEVLRVVGEILADNLAVGVG